MGKRLEVRGCGRSGIRTEGARRQTQGTPRTRKLFSAHPLLRSRPGSGEVPPRGVPAPSVADRRSPRTLRDGAPRRRASPGRRGGGFTRDPPVSAAAPASGTLLGGGFAASGLVRTIGNRVGIKPRGFQSPHPPPVAQRPPTARTLVGAVGFRRRTRGHACPRRQLPEPANCEWRRLPTPTDPVGARSPVGQTQPDVDSGPERTRPEPIDSVPVRRRGSVSLNGDEATAARSAWRSWQAPRPTTRADPDPGLVNLTPVRERPPRSARRGGSTAGWRATQRRR